MHSHLLETNFDTSLVLGSSPSIQVVNSVVSDIASTDIPVLLTGESGTGKDVYARLIHQVSGLSGDPMRKINCLALSPENLQRQILGTSPRRTNGVGKGSSLFLDNVHDLDAGCQRLLLSLLSSDDSAGDENLVSVRVISATPRDLKHETETGAFRRELYFRINGVCLHLPALRERKEDIPALLDYFLDRHSAQLQKARPVVDSEQLSRLMAHSWPGNIRELENVVKKMVALGQTGAALGDLRPAEHIQVKPAEATHTPSLKVAARLASREAERELILKTLDRTRWNRKRAAQELQISYKSLLYKLKYIGISGSESAKD